MKKRKLIPMLFGAALFSTVLFGCADEGGPDADGVTTLTFFNADGSSNQNWDNAVAEEITRLTGVRIEQTHPLEGDESQDIALMLASGDFPDLIMAKGSLSQLVDAGAVLRLDDFIEERGADIQQLFGPYIGRMRFSYERPHIYEISGAPVLQANLTTSGTAQIQMDVMRYLGFPEIRTLDDLTEALRAYQASHPYIDGQPVIPLMLLGSDWRWLITVGNPAGFALGFQDDGEWIVNEETGEATFKYLDPGFREYFRWLNQMNAEGLLYIGSFTQTHDAYLANIASGRVLAILDQDWNFGSAQTALRDVEVHGEYGWRQFMPIGPTLSADIIPMAPTRPSGFMSGLGISIAADSPNAELAFDFLNFMASEEGQILRHWGVEGVHWQFNEAGEREFLPEIEADRLGNPNFSYETGIGQYIHPFPNSGNLARDSRGLPFVTETLDQIIADFTPAQRQTLDAFGATTFIDLFPAPTDFTVPRHGQVWNLPIPTDSPLRLIQQHAEAFVQEHITASIFVDPADFDAQWDFILQGLEELNIQEANELMTAFVQQRLALWEQ